MSRRVRTATIPEAQDSHVPTGAGDLPPSVLLNPRSMRARAIRADTLTADAAQNGHAADSTAAPGSIGNQPNGKLHNGASGNGLTAVRRAVPAVSLEHSPSFYPKQEWVGRVTAIHADEFDARLHDLTGGGREVATIDLEEIGPEDRTRMHVGSLFHWMMGYERSPSGTRSNVSRIVFLDSPRPTERDWKAGEEWADRLRAKWNLD